MKQLVRLSLFVLAAITTWEASASVSEAPSELRWRVEVSSLFARHERAWASYQLKGATDQYDTFALASAKSLPSLLSGLFESYKIVPASRSDATMSLVSTNGTDTVLCLEAVLKSANEFSGFVKGVERAGASWATSSCAPGALGTGLTFPLRVYARKAIAATRAKALIDKDTAERAAQAAVASTIAFTLPNGKLMDFSTAANTTTAVQTVTLTNRTTGAWSLSTPVVTGPFTASYSGCTLVLPGLSCSVRVAYSPTAAGKHYGTVSVPVALAGKTLVLRTLGRTP